MGRLDHLLQARLAKRAESSKLRRLTISQPGGVDFSSNDYLSLAANAELQRAVLSKLEARVASSERNECPRAILGSGGSRLLDGNSTFAEGLEKRLAEFHGAPAALLFNSAYDANVGLLSCVPQAGDIILYDEAIHASVHDGMRMSRASRRLPFSHSSVAGISENGAADQGTRPSLNEMLRKITSGGQGKLVREGIANVFVCVEGMYSMDGSVVCLREVVESVETHLPLQNGYVIVDEAHSVGILGDQGRGLVCELGLEKRVWARVHGFGKALGCAGGE
jgi:8-amino-7-oxononanoate synthase